jgi:hypothetical protein
MTTALRVALIGLVVLLLLGAGVWYYLFGPNKTAAEDLVPADTLAFATIPNGMGIAADYQTSQLKSLVDAPEAKPMLDSLAGLVGQKNLDLLQSFLPEMSGQSFLAVTHYDLDHPAQAGLIAALRPKTGIGDFNAFVDKVKAAYPLVMAQGTSGTSNVEGLDYQWIKGPGATDKICVAQYRGWIVTTWGEDALRDWWERLHKRSATPSLAQNADYKKSVDRVGKGSEAILYIDYHAILGLMRQQLAQKNQPGANYLATKYQALGALAVGTRFEKGQIADRFSFLIPRQAQNDLGVPGPCAFDTLKFTGPDTRFYWGASLNFAQIWKNMQEQASQTPRVNPMASAWVTYLQNWAQSKNLDVQKNIIAPLGSEASIQAEWSSDSTYPEAGLFVKLDQPNDFKPVEAAIVDTVRQAYATSAVINEINSDSQNFATIKFIQALPISPTITEDGPYFGVFLTENQAVRAFKRDVSVGLLTNGDFQNQIGEKWKGASQLVFLDSPQLFNRAYQTALPYVPLAAMFNRTLGALVQNRTLPPDLNWLAPIGTWSFVGSTDDDGANGLSISGIGNQGIFLGAGLGAGAMAWQTWFHPAAMARPFSPIVIPPPSSAQIPAPAVVAPPLAPAPTNTVTIPATPSTNDLTPPAPPTNFPSPLSPPAPDSTTNTPPAPSPAPTGSNAPPSAPASPQ